MDSDRILGKACYWRYCVGSDRRWPEVKAWNEKASTDKGSAILLGRTLLILYGQHLSVDSCVLRGGVSQH